MWVVFLIVQVKTEDPEVDRKSVCSKKSSASPVSPSSAVPVLDAHHITAKTSPRSTATLGIPAARGTALYNPEIELSTDTEDSSSDLAGETGKAFDNHFQRTFSSFVLRHYDYRDQLTWRQFCSSMLKYGYHPYRR